jgi:hypothetical protein
LRDCRSYCGRSNDDVKLLKVARSRNNADAKKNSADAKKNNADAKKPRNS